MGEGTSPNTSQLEQIKGALNLPPGPPPLSPVMRTVGPRVGGQIEDTLNSPPPLAPSNHARLILLNHLGATVEGKRCPGVKSFFLNLEVSSEPFAYNLVVILLTPQPIRFIFHPPLTFPPPPKRIRPGETLLDVTSEFIMHNSQFIIPKSPCIIHN